MLVHPCVAEAGERSVAELEAPQSAPPHSQSGPAQRRGTSVLSAQHRGHGITRHTSVHWAALHTLVGLVETSFLGWGLKLKV